jgi:hypothetical protein
MAAQKSEAAIPATVQFNTEAGIGDRIIIGDYPHSV